MAQSWKIRSLIALTFALLPLGGALAQQVPPITEPLTVDEAVAIALRQNPTITRAGQDVRIAEAQVEAARANRRPDVNLTVNASYDPDPLDLSAIGGGGDGGGDGEGEGEGTSQDRLTIIGQVSASQPVWPSTRWKAPVSSARAGVGLAQESLSRTRQTIAYQTRQAFFQLLSSQELLDVTREAVALAQTQLRLARATVEAGTAARIDIFQAEAAVAEAEVSRVQAENNVNLSRSALATQMGFPANTPVRITPPPAGELPVVPADPEALATQAVQTRPELVQLNFRREQLRASIDLIRLQQQPLINVQADYGKQLYGGVSLGSLSDGLTLAAVASLNLYNGGQTRAELQAARIQLEQVDTTARQLELNVRLEVRQAWLNLQNAVQQLTAAEQQRRAAGEAMRIAQIRYENGEGTQYEWDQARLRYTQALTALTQARFQAQVAAAQLSLAVGAPVPAPTTPVAPGTPVAPAAPAAGG